MCVFIVCVCVCVRSLPLSLWRVCVSVPVMTFIHTIYPEHTEFLRVSVCLCVCVKWGVMVCVLCVFHLVSGCGLKPVFPCAVSSNHLVTGSCAVTSLPFYCALVHHSLRWWWELTRISRSLSLSLSVRFSSPSPSISLFPSFWMKRMKREEKRKGENDMYCCML